MTDLPASIEAALQEAGFSGTEIIVLKKLLQEDALTLRELAGKTGKSTGVLDAAVKKLLKKGILSREMINEAPKYVLKSLDVVMKWMEDDTKMKQDMMVRRQQNFETFIRSLVVEPGARRPEMEYFEGREGIKKAYMQLLNRGNDIAQYGPTLYLTEEDPLRDFKVQWFRERQHRGIFLRVITDNTVLGRRFQSRDPYEYRKTILVDPDVYPLQFERLIIGDTIACFQSNPDRAVFVRFPEYAEAERVFFERLWNKKIQTPVERSGEDVSGKQQQPPADVITVPFKTKTLSLLREFFLGKKSIAVLLGFGVVAAALTYGLYLRDIAFNTKRVQERALSIAATGALQFDPADIEQVHTPDDMHKPQYAKLVYQLNLIRSQNPGMKYAYLMRPTDDAMTLAFIADADSLDPTAKKDLNFDGVIDQEDWLSPPGEPYDISEIPAMQKMFLGESTVDQVPHNDQWGTFISGYGPIKDESGKTIALFGADIEANTVQNLSKNMIVLSFTFISLFITLVLVRLLAFNRSLFKELQQLLRVRKNILIICGGGMLSCTLSAGLYLHLVVQEISQVRDRITTIAATAAAQFDATDLDQLHSVKDMSTPVFSKVTRQLHDIRQSNNNIKFVYIIRPFADSRIFEFIADADSYGLDLMQWHDLNGNKVSDPYDVIPYPGLAYDVTHIDILNHESFYTPVSTKFPYSDQWGTVLTGYAPIKNKAGIVSGLLAVDVDVSSVYVLQPVVLLPLGIYLLLLLFYFLFWSPGIRSSLLYDLVKRFCTRKILSSVGLGLVIAYWVVFGFYSYKDHLLIQEKGKRLMAIAATAASQINPDDLANLRFAKDMKRAEYQRLFKLLNDVRNKNEGIEYVYILRPTETEGIWEFVVDADTNYFVPFVDWDYTGDGVIDESDENVAPGVALDVDFSYPKLLASFRNGLNKVMFEDSMVLDQWGAGYSAFAPIIQNGKAVAVLGVDDEMDYRLSPYR